MPSTSALTIKQLHDDTGALVRLAGSSKRPVAITDRGQEVAVITNRSQLKPQVRKRVLLPEFEALMARSPSNDVLDDLNAVRGER
jgi:PHD/YefM family antitoxin component YafN of YafNO toxin-antitoxin module